VVHNRRKILRIFDLQSYLEHLSSSVSSQVFLFSWATRFPSFCSLGGIGFLFSQVHSGVQVFPGSLGGTSFPRFPGGTSFPSLLGLKGTRFPRFLRGHKFAQLPWPWRHEFLRFPGHRATSPPRFPRRYPDKSHPDLLLWTGSEQVLGKFWTCSGQVLAEF